MGSNAMLDGSRFHCTIARGWGGGGGGGRTSICNNPLQYEYGGKTGDVLEGSHRVHNIRWQFDSDLVKKRS